MTNRLKGKMLTGAPETRMSSPGGGAPSEATAAVKEYCVYIMTNLSGTLYVGVTNDLQRRICEHRQGLLPGFTARYKIDRLVYWEATPDVQAAIGREKQIKGWLRRKKVALVESMNPRWADLSEHWFEGGE